MLDSQHASGCVKEIIVRKISWDLQWRPKVISEVVSVTSNKSVSRLDAGMAWIPGSE